MPAIGEKYGLLLYKIHVTFYYIYIYVYPYRNYGYKNMGVGIQ